MPPSLMACHGSRILAAALDRGFTTVRDAAGADGGLARALEPGLIQGPRLRYCGRALSQTGGHGDMRGADEDEACGCHGIPPPSQGLLPACGSSLWPGGIRTRWMETPNFRT